MGNVLNILHGPCEVFINGTSVGYTTGGVRIRKSVEQLDVEADQVVGVIVKKTSMERMFVATTLLESTLENLMKAMSEPASNTAGSGDLEYGSASPEVQEYLLTLTGAGPNGKTRRYTLYRAAVSGDREFTFGERGAVTSIPIEWECMKDPTRGNKFGYHEDLTT